MWFVWQAIVRGTSQCDSRDVIDPLNGAEVIQRERPLLQERGNSVTLPTATSRSEPGRAATCRLVLAFRSMLRLGGIMGSLQPPLPVIAPSNECGEWILEHE